MGMDVYGQNGEYFRSSIWSWRPLAEYVCDLAPELTNKGHGWQTNDGHGLNAKDAIKLAKLLEAELSSGGTERYEAIYKSRQLSAPKDPCLICEATGIRQPIPLRGAGDSKTGIKCNGCDGEGYRDAWLLSYPFQVSHVREFAAFLRTCGGFKIY